jgi:hypothetical protein
MRYGRFRISAEYVKENPAYGVAAIVGLAIVRAEHMFVWDAIEYHAIGPDFAELQEGAVIPEYKPIMHLVDGKPVRVGWE